jgi:diacylglycerol kinase (ATP)
MEELQVRKFIFLVNPISGTKEKKIKIDYIHKVATEQQLQYNFYDTNAEGDYYWLLEKITEEDVTDIVILGGDGTVNTVVNQLRFAAVNIGIIPCGSGNGLAFAAKIPKNYKKALAIILKGNSILIDAFLINNNFACMLSGLGFDAAVAHNFAKQSSRGLVTYTKQSLYQFFRAKPYNFEITIDGFGFFVEAYFISIANSNQFGNHFTIAPKASLNDGLLDIVIVQKMSKLSMPFAILQQIRGKNKLQNIVDQLKNNSIIYLQNAAITIKNKQLAPLHIDGEVAVTSEHFQFQIIKDCFTLLVP